MATLIVVTSGIVTLNSSTGYLAADFGYTGTGILQAEFDPKGFLKIKSRETGYFTDLRSGEVLHHTVRHGMGHPDHPVSDEVVMRKFLDCAALAPRPPKEAQVHAFWDVVQKLETLQAGEFTAALRALAGHPQ